MTLSYRHFACPQVHGNERTAEVIAVIHSVSAVEMLLARDREVILNRTEGLLELLNAWLATKTDFETTWDLAFGRVVRAIESNEVDAVDVLAEVGLRLAARGNPGRWTAALCEKRRLCWDGRWLLPEACEIAVDSNGTVATVELRLLSREQWTTTFHRTGQGWQTEGVEQLMQVGVRRPITLLSSQAVPHDMIVEDDFHSIFEFPLITSDMAESLAAALEILDRHAPEYLDWVERVLRSVLVCRCRSSRTRSSSWMHAPGIILMSSSVNPIEVAEMLVHECSHQYYYLVSRLATVVHGNDTQEYYSPAVQKSRPLSKILVAYHAFANILLFYRTLMRTGLAGDLYCHAMESRLSVEVKELEQSLRDSSDLTTSGLDLYLPLMEQLADARSSGGSV